MSEWRDGQPDPATIGEALVVWTGWGDAASPLRDERRLVEVYGDDGAAALLPALRALESDFWESDARHRIGDLAEMGVAAKAEFRARHPEIPDAAAEALAWCYTFDNR